MEKKCTNFLALPVLLILFLSPICLADSELYSSANFPTTEAEKLIRGLNLLPKDVNIVDQESDLSGLPQAKKIVEKKFKFPNLVDPGGVSVEDLGHHAGYYQIQHSHAAKYVVKPLEFLDIWML